MPSPPPKKAQLMIPLMGLNISCWEFNLETSKHKFWRKKVGKQTKQNEGGFLYLVGGFSPVETYYSKWNLPQIGVNIKSI